MEGGVGWWVQSLMVRREGEACDVWDSSGVKLQRGEVLMFMMRCGGRESKNTTRHRKRRTVIQLSRSEDGLAQLIK